MDFPSSLVGLFMNIKLSTMHNIHVCIEEIPSREKIHRTFKKYLRVCHDRYEVSDFFYKNENTYPHTK